jgi:hypothetical protein
VYVPKDLDVEAIFAETAYDAGDRFEDFYDAKVRGSRESREVILYPYKYVCCFLLFSFLLYFLFFGKFWLMIWFPGILKMLIYLLKLCKIL